MGNRSSHQQNILTRNWLRISPSFLRNTLTNQLIQEHEIRFETHEEQSDFVALLNKRMASHHPHVVKVIYFKIQGENCYCSLNAKRYSLLLYTEYQGPSLAAQISSKTVQHTSTCNCINIVTVLEHLQETYGSFEINEQLMFMNLRPDVYPGEKTFKLWINSKVEQCRREKPCNEQQMALSALNMLKLLADHGQCRVMQSHQLSELAGANTLFRLKEELLKLHIKRKKINSFNVQNSRLQRQSSILGEGQQNQRGATVKVSSMPQKMTIITRFPNNPQLSARVLNDESNRIVSNRATNDPRLEINHRALHLKDENMYVKPYSAAKFNFNYSKNLPYSQRNVQAFPTTGIIPILKFNTSQRNFQSPRTFFDSPRINNNSHNNPIPSSAIKNSEPVFVTNQKNDGQLKKEVPPPNVLRESEFSVKTVHSSPLQSEKEYKINQINKDTKVVVHQIITGARTQNNSASPRYKNNEVDQTNQIEDLPDRLDKKAMLSGNTNQKDQKNASLTSSGKKFQKYSQALKDYEEKIKRKNSNRQQRRDKPVKIDKKINKLVPQEANQAQFKETNSIYNESIEDTDEKQRRRTPSQFKKSSKSKTEEEQNDKENDRISIQNQEEQRKRKVSEQKQNRDKEEQRRQQKEEEQRAARQQKQKQELQRDLEKEKRLIQKEMEGLLRHNNLEYRNIREKVKQKKQTFAQLKAEASKILEDLF